MFLIADLWKCPRVFSLQVQQVNVAESGQAEARSFILLLGLWKKKVIAIESSDGSNIVPLLETLIGSVDVNQLGWAMYLDPQMKLEDKSAKTPRHTCL